MNLEFDHSHSYGRHLFYPKNADAITLCELLGRKSITLEQIQICRKAGWHTNVNFNDELKDLRCLLKQA